MIDVLRPETLDQYIGQAKLKERLNTRIESALVRKRPLDHMLFCSPPGYGKTSLSRIIAKETYEPFESLTMPFQDIYFRHLLENFQGVVLLDEGHRLSTKQQESLLPLLEFGVYTTDKGWEIQSCWLTIIMATTEPEKIIKPLYDRFSFRPEWEPYSTEDMTRILLGMASKAEVVMDEEIATTLSLACAGTPRMARQFILAARDILAIGQNLTPARILDLCGCAPDGLTETHVKYLTSLKGVGGQAGAKVLSNMLRLNEDACLDLERLLIEKRFVEYTARGRIITSMGVRRLTQMQS